MTIFFNRKDGKKKDDEEEIPNNETDPKELPKKFWTKAFLLFFAFSATTSLAQSNSSALDKGVQNITTKVYHVQESDHIVVAFPTGSEQLSVAEEQKVKSFIEFHGQDGGQLKVTIAAWADFGLIGKSSTADIGTDMDRELAEQRLENLAEFVHDLDTSTNVEMKYNMAEQPSSLGRVLQTRDAKVKEAMEIGLLTDSRELNRDVEIFSKNGGGKKAVIIVQR